ncbi:hypothetical protein AB0M28_04075 [Streptomyces sp. NPDC051940]|uniref:hypothetical protein n=1 Tax=Streptomyces sp. NPDC051940 TaxID=3155675 RepID=UPI003425E17F
MEIVVDGPIPVDRDDIEDGLTEVFEGTGEVVGAGTGEHFSHLDLEVDPSLDRTDVLNRVFSLLAALGAGDSVRVRPGDGETWYRPGEWSGA